MELDRRQFLQWSAAAAALLALACRRNNEPMAPEKPRQKLAPSGPVLRTETVLYAGDSALPVVLEHWGGFPIGIRGIATAPILDLLPLYYDERRLASWNGSLQQLDPLRKLLHKGKPWVVLAPQAPTEGLSLLLEHGIAQSRWDVVSGEASQWEWNETRGHLEKGNYQGMLRFATDSNEHLPAWVEECWEHAPQRVAMAFAQGRITEQTNLCIPWGHPFAQWDLHRLSDGSLAWQKPMGTEDAAGLGILLAALLDVDWQPGLWRNWLEATTKRNTESGLQSNFAVQPSFCNYPPSAWLREARYAHKRLPGESAVHLERATMPSSPAKIRWGMTIDLDLCDACGACTMACSLENNVPVVGDAEAAKGRTLHWLRVIDGIPLLCQQCADAPCEAACPIRATTHSSDGLNEQNYARCGGIRYCAVHCPWNMRRFVFGIWPGQGVQIAFNPRVPLRPRGVMEKCTFCVQRIRDAAPGTVALPACSEACPRQAIRFGNWNDSASAVRQACSGRALWRLQSLGHTDTSVIYLRGKA